MKKFLVLTMIAMSMMLAPNTVSKAGEVVDSNTATVDAVLGAKNSKKEDCNRPATSTNVSTNEVANATTNNETSGSSDVATNNTASNTTVTPSYNTTKTVSMAAVEQKIARKGGEALSMFQIVGYVIITICLIVALIRLAAVHATGSNDASLRNAGFGGVVICCVCYVLVYAGPFILEFFKNWILS